MVAPPVGLVAENLLTLTSPWATCLRKEVTVQEVEREHQEVLPVAENIPLAELQNLAMAVQRSAGWRSSANPAPSNHFHPLATMRNHCSR